MIITTLTIYIVLISAFAYWMEKRTINDVYKDRSGVWRYRKPFKEGQLIKIPLEALQDISRSASVLSAGVGLMGPSFIKAAKAFSNFGKAAEKYNNKGDC